MKFPHRVFFGRFAPELSIFVFLVFFVNVANVAGHPIRNPKSEHPSSGDQQNQTEAFEAQQVSSDELTISAYWAPFADSKYKFGDRWQTLKELKPVEPAKKYQQDDLAVFLPPKDAEQGDIWKIDPATTLPFLKQFHDGATIVMHHGGPTGAYGCLAAENNDFMRIRTRTHAEFNLKDGKYVPSQFAGDMVVEKSTGDVIAFKLAVPSRRNNVDLNWERKPKEGERWVDEDGNVIPAKVSIVADIGYCPRLELVGGDWEKANRIKWDRELSYREVDTKLRKRFYRFAQIDWLPFEEAVAQSVESGKPLHVVALFGVLDDESC